MSLQSELARIARELAGHPEEMQAAARELIERELGVKAKVTYFDLGAGLSKYELPIFTPHTQSTYGWLTQSKMIYNQYIATDFAIDWDAEQKAATTAFDAEATTNAPATTTGSFDYKGVTTEYLAKLTSLIGMQGQIAVTPPAWTNGWSKPYSFYQPSLHMGKQYAGLLAVAAQQLGAKYGYAPSLDDRLNLPGVTLTSRVMSLVSLAGKCFDRSLDTLATYHRLPRRA